MIKYKVLKKDLTSPFKGFQYELGKHYVCEDFDDNAGNSCSRGGFYATDIEGIVYSWANTGEFVVVEVDVGGRSVELPPYKCRYETQVINRILSMEEVLSLAKEMEPSLGYELSEIIHPVNPLLMPEKELADRHIQLLEEWVSVGYSVRVSVGYSVRVSVWDSIWDSVGDTVGDSIRASIRASVGARVLDSVRARVLGIVLDSVLDIVGAYLSSLFPNIEKWKGTNHEPGVNPFQPAIDLWHEGFVPSFDGNTWRLHQGPEMKIVFEMGI